MKTSKLSVFLCYVKLLAVESSLIRRALENRNKNLFAYCKKDGLITLSPILCTYTLYNGILTTFFTILWIIITEWVVNQIIGSFFCVFRLINSRSVAPLIIHQSIGFYSVWDHSFEGIIWFLLPRAWNGNFLDQWIISASLLLC